jgi:hypothetical protein
LILGYPGTGKFTVAKELVASLAADDVPVRLIDNHATANVLFNLIAEADGKTPLPRQVLDGVREINQIVVRTIETLSPPNWSFVFTHHRVDSEVHRSSVRRLEEAAENRGSTFLPVVLSCDREVLLGRVTDPGRRLRNKLIDSSIAADIIDQGMLIPDRALLIDVTVRPPAQTAQLIRSAISNRSVKVMTKTPPLTYPANGKTLSKVQMIAPSTPEYGSYH